VIQKVKIQEGWGGKEGDDGMTTVTNNTTTPSTILKY